MHFPAGARLSDIDAMGYHQLACNLLDGRGFSLSGSAPYLADTIRTPIYPLFIASIYTVFGRNPYMVALVQGVLDAGICLLLWKLVYRLTKSQAAALMAGLLYALNPTLWRFSDSLQTETLLAFVIACIALVFSRPISSTLIWPRLRKGIVLGLLCGLAVLIKPNVLLVPALVILWLSLERGISPRVRWAQAATTLIFALLIIAPWCIRNWITVGRPIISSAFEDNLSHVSATATLIHAQNEVVAPWTPRWEAVYGTIIAEAARRFSWSSTPLQSAYDVYQRQQQLAVIAGEIIRQHPVDFALSHLDGFLRSWVPQEHRFWYEFLSGQSWDTLGTAEGAAGTFFHLVKANGMSAALAFLWQERFAKLPPLAFALWGGWLAAYVLGAFFFAIGSWHLRKDYSFVGLVWSLIFYVTFLPGPIAYIRFQVPVAPLFVAVIAAGLVSWRPLVSRQVWGRFSLAQGHRLKEP